MRDQDEQARIREHFEAEPGKGHLAEEAYGELENARALGDDSGVLRAEAKLAGLGYQTREQREDAAAARKEHAEAAAREAERIRANRGAAAAHDDHDGDAVVQRAGVVDQQGDPISRPVLADRGDHLDGTEKNVDDGKGKNTDTGTGAKRAEAAEGEGEPDAKTKARARRTPPAGRRSTPKTTA